MNPLMKIVCGNCGNQAPQDTGQSTENWIVHDLKKPCENCGKTQWEMRWIDDGGTEL